MTLVDTSVWIDYLRNRSTPATQWLDSNLERQRIGLTDLVFREVLQGERTLDGMSTLAEAFNGFEVLTTGGESSRSPLQRTTSHCATGVLRSAVLSTACWQRTASAKAIAFCTTTATSTLLKSTSALRWFAPSGALPLRYLHHLHRVCPPERSEDPACRWPCRLGPRATTPLCEFRAQTSRP